MKSRRTSRELRSTRAILDLWAEDLVSEAEETLFSIEKSMPEGAYPLATVARALAQLGWSSQGLDLDDCNDLCLLAEAVNWAAKVVDPGFYAFKARVVAAARSAGALGGWGEDEQGDAVYYLWAPLVGETSYHDPHGEISEALAPSSAQETWPCGWSGVERQHLAQDLLTSRAGDGAMLAAMAADTSRHVLRCF